MTQAVALLIIGVVCLALVPIAPRMVSLRIHVLRFLHWQSFADWHQRHRAGLTLGLRLVMTALGVVLITMGLSGL